MKKCISCDENKKISKNITKAKWIKKKTNKEGHPPEKYVNVCNNVINVDINVPEKPNKKGYWYASSSKLMLKRANIKNLKNISAEKAYNEYKNSGYFITDHNGYCNIVLENPIKYCPENKECYEEHIHIKFFKNNEELEDIVYTVSLSNKNIEFYDTIIIGAGISGLYTAYKLLKKNKLINILLCEKNSYIGGKIYTYKPLNHDVQYEAGAGRFSENHKLLINLINELGYSQEIYQISNERIPLVRNKIWSNYKNRPDLENLYRKSTFNDNKLKLSNNTKFEIKDIINKVLENSNKYDDNFLKNISFYNLIQNLFDSSKAQFILDSFGYISELLHINALDAIHYEACCLRINKRNIPN